MFKRYNDFKIQGGLLMELFRGIIYGIVPSAFLWTLIVMMGMWIF